MRVSNWNPQKYDGEFLEASMDRLEQAAEVVASKARRLVNVRTGKLKDTIRVTKKHEKYGTGVAVFKERNVRVYAGTENVRYAWAQEYVPPPKGKPFLRPALRASKNEIREIIGGK